MFLNWVALHKVTQLTNAPIRGDYHSNKEVTKMKSVGILQIKTKLLRQTTYFPAGGPSRAFFF